MPQEEVVPHRTSRPEDDDEHENMTLKGPEQRQNDLVEEVPVEFRDAVQENIEAEQPPTRNQPLQAEKDEEVDEQFVAVQEDEPEEARRSTRNRRKPDKFGHNIYDS